MRKGLTGQSTSYVGQLRASFSASLKAEVDGSKKIDDFVTAIGLVLVIEGVICALFHKGCKE